VGFLALVLLAGWVCPARAGDSTEIKVFKGVSRPGTVAIVAGAAILPLVNNEGHNEALRVVDAVGTASLVSIGIKHLIDAPRPDGTGHDAFPSSHATAAFAAATMAADNHPDQAPYWYSAAALIAYSRVRLDRHRTRDVLAGAFLGFTVAKLEQSLPDGMLLAPLIESEDGCTGVELVWEF